MIIYKTSIILHEATFFASREVGNFYITEPLIGNYALAYAFGFVKSLYHPENAKIYYNEHLTELNQKKIYVTPGTPKKINFITSRFNALSDSYWSKMDKNAIATTLEEKNGARVNAKNFPQSGFIKMLGIYSSFDSYIISEKPILIPQYLRLGKFNSKAKVILEKKYEAPEVAENEEKYVDIFLNPLDLPENASIKSYTLFSVPPSPLISNSLINTSFFHLGDKNYIPKDMKFNIPEIQKEKKSKKKK